MSDSGDEARDENPEQQPAPAPLRPSSRLAKSDDLLAEDPDLKDVGEADLRQLAALRIQRVQEGYAGPIPAPEVLERFREVDPKAVEWIFNAADEERKHRHW